MSDYIKREDAIDAIYGYGKFAQDIIKRIPAANVVERKTGKWEEYGEPNAHGKFEIGYHKCNLCGAIGIKEFNYCPNCGAEMEMPDD